MPGNEWWVRSAIDLSGAGIGACYFDGFTVIESITVVPETQNAKLRLTCNPGTTVQRGTPITCTAGTSPAGAVRTELSWTFTDSAGHRIPGPTGTDTTWGGEIVVGGMMKVEGKVNGSASADSVRIRVTPRSWPRIGLRVREDGHGDLPPPSQVDSFAKLAHTHLARTAPSLSAKEITDGPNAGWGYLNAPLDSLDVVVHLNDAWMPGNVWYNLQHPGPWTDPAGNVGQYCSQHQLPLVFKRSREHEGFLSSPLTSHVEVYRRWFRNNSPQDSLEAVVLYKPELPAGTSVRDWILNASYPQYVETPANSDPDQRHTNANPPGLVDPAPWPCMVRLFP